MNPLYGIDYPDVPVYFAINGHRYMMMAFYYDEDGRGPDPFAGTNGYELTDLDTGAYTYFVGKNARQQLCDYPLAGGATIRSDMASFDYLHVGSETGEECGESASGGSNPS